MSLRWLECAGKHDLTVCLQHAGLEGVDEVDVAESLLIEWRGPEVWERER